MLIAGVSLEKQESRLMDAMVNLQALQVEISKCRRAGYDIETLDHEQEALIKQTIDLLQCCIEEISDLILDEELNPVLRDEFGNIIVSADECQ